jgi:molybdate transport system regulatory protein
MNRIKANIAQISSSGGVILVDMVAENCPMSALLIDVANKPDWLKKDNNVYIIFKETEVSIGKNVEGKISLRNKIPCIITHIERGELMSLISMDFEGHNIDSAITTRSVDMLELEIGDKVTAFIKANELTLMKI